MTATCPVRRQGQFVVQAGEPPTGLSTCTLATFSVRPRRRSRSSVQVEGRHATLVYVGDETLSPLVFDLEHLQALRARLVRIGELDFELRVHLVSDAEAKPVFRDIIERVKQVFQDNGLHDVKVQKGEAPPKFTASGKFREVVRMRRTALLER